MKKIKILRIIARLNIGGPAVHTVLLTEGLDKERFESLLVCGTISKDEGDMSYYAHKKDIKLIFVPELKRELDFLSDFKALCKIYNIIKIEQPDIIHTHTAKAGTLGRLAGIFYNLLSFQKDKRIKLIHTFHGHIFDGYFNKFKTNSFILIERILAFFTCRIITVSGSLKKELISLRIAKESKILVVPLGLELGSFLKIPFRDEVVLNIGIVGRLVPIKNHRLFLEAAAKVISDNPTAQLKFNIIGDGELRGGLERYSSQLGISEKVDFLGWEKDPVNIYSDLDVVALTSINEGTPVSLIEGMASGKPVVAVDVGGVRGLLGDDVGVVDELKEDFKILKRGIIVKPQDPLSFSRALTFLLQNTALRKNMGMYAREYVKTKFAKERLIRDLEGLYIELLGLSCSKYSPPLPY